MYFYQIEFRDRDTGKITTKFVKSEMMQNPDGLIAMLSMDEHPMGIAKMKEQFWNAETITAKTAETRFSASEYTVRRRCRHGDFFVKPTPAIAQVALVLHPADNAAPMVATLFVPVFLVNDDCTGDAVRRVLRDVAAEASGVAPNKARWSDFTKATAETMARYGIATKDAGVFLTIDANKEDPVKDESVFSVDHAVSHKRIELINKFLDNREHQDEDEPCSETVQFPNGCQMDIKCCGVQDEEEGSWTEAVLFAPNGAELCFTEPEDEFLGVWELECDGVTYRVNVIDEADLPVEKEGGR